MSDNDSSKLLLGCFAFACILIVCGIVTYFAVAGLTYVICLGFGLEWSWALSAGVMAVIVLAALVRAILA